MTTWRVSDLLGHSIVSESGWKHGHVYDVRLDLGDDGKAPRVVGLVVGRYGLIERLAGHERREEPTVTPKDVIPWSMVQSIGDTIVVSDERK